MITIEDWLTDLSQNYSVEKVDDVKRGSFYKHIKGDIYLIKNTDVKK